MYRTSDFVWLSTGGSSWALWWWYCRPTKVAFHGADQAVQLLRDICICGNLINQRRIIGDVAQETGALVTIYRLSAG